MTTTIEFGTEVLSVLAVVAGVVASSNVYKKTDDKNTALSAGYFTTILFFVMSIVAFALKNLQFVEIPSVFFIVVAVLNSLIVGLIFNFRK